VGIALAASVVGVAVFRAIGSSGLPMPGPSSSEFDGRIAGWRIAGEDVLIQAGLIGGPLNGLTCRGREIDPATKTNLDFSLTYLPEGLRVRGSPGVSKVRCDALTTIVSAHYELDAAAGTAILDIDRELVDRAAFPIEADADRVSAGTVGGHPAVFVNTNPVNGQSEILVIQDGVFDPDAVVLHIIAYNVSFDDLVRVAAGIR
jgi:hypothetical protein